MESRDDRIVGIKSPGDLGDYEASLDKIPKPPQDFTVVLAPDKQHNLITVGDNVAPEGRTTVAKYRVYFTPYSALPKGRSITEPEVIDIVFKAGQLVGSVDAPGKGGDVSFYDRQFVQRLDNANNPIGGGWFFATAVNLRNVESGPTSAIASPLLTPDGSSGDSTIPPDVQNAQVTLRPYNSNNGMNLVELIVEALIPLPVRSFAGYQIWLYNYKNTGEFEQGKTFYRYTQASGPLIGSFLLDPDVPRYYSTGSIDIVNHSPTVIGEGNPMWNNAWGKERQLGVYAIDESVTNGNETGYQMMVQSVNAAVPSLTVDFTVPGWRTKKFVPYAVYHPWTQSDGLALQNNWLMHRVRIYFVSISQAGTHRADVENAPFVEFPFGLSAALSPPLNPVGLTVTSNGSTFTLTWQAIDNSGGSTNYDSTLSHFNIYRARAGAYLTTNADPTNYFPARPTTVYATVKFDKTSNNGGIHTFVDRKFNINASIDASQDPDGWDFDPTNPGEYVYWVSAVNIEGGENLSCYFGGVSVTSGVKTVTYVGGDAFSHDFAGKTMTINGVAYTIDSFDSPTQVTLSTNYLGTTGVATYTIESATGRNVLTGNVGVEDDPTVNRDTFSQRLFNAGFFANINSIVDVPITHSFNSAYAQLADAAGQPTYRWYYSADFTYKEAGMRFSVPQLGIQRRPAQFTQPPKIDGALHDDDSWSLWEYLFNGTGTIPSWRSDGTLANCTGEIVMDPTAQTTATDYSVLWQQVRTSKFLPGENLVMYVFAKSVGATPAGASGVLRLQMIRFDSQPYTGGTYTPDSPDGVERDVFGGDFSVSNIPSNAAGYTTNAPFAIIGKLPQGNPPTLTGLTVTTGSPNVAGTGFNTQWVGTPITITTGAGSLTTTIKQISGGSPAPSTDNTLMVLANNWPNANSSIATAAITIKFDHYAFKISLVGPCDQKILFWRPMVNGGRKPAAWTPELIADDQPFQTGDNGNPDIFPNPKPCTPAGTLISTPRGERPIEALVAGEDAWAIMKGRIRKTKIRRVWRGSTNKMLTFVAGMTRLECTPSHKIGIPGGSRGIRYVEAHTLKPGDFFFVLDRGIVSKKEIDLIIEGPDSREVFTLTCFPIRNYFTNGVLSHNKPVDPNNP